MEPTKFTVTQWMLIGGGFGLVTGLIPLFAGFIKKKIKLGVIGFIGSIIGGVLLGLLLAIPVAAIFTWLIIRGRKEPAEVVVVNDTPIDVSLNKTNDK